MAENNKDREDAVFSGETKREAYLEALERDVWPSLDPELRARRLTRAEEDEMLGYGPEGV